VETLIGGLKYVKALSETMAWKKSTLVALPTPLCSKEYTPWTNEYYKCVVLNYSFTVWHPTSTCKMGSKKDPMAVVDSQLKVIGIQNLRVIGMYQ
jgi:choline dehydrogenase-like flavoprotein